MCSFKSVVIFQDILNILEQPQVLPPLLLPPPLSLAYRYDNDPAPILFSELLHKIFNFLLALGVHIYHLSYPCLYFKYEFLCKTSTLNTKEVMAPALIPARHGLAIPLKAGETLKIINTHGTQVIDTWAFTVSSSKITSLSNLSPHRNKYCTLG